ncbi:MAG: hypothetical protein ACE37M_08360 [Henriciella sp.]
MLRSIVGTIVLILLASTADADNLFWVKPIQTLKDVPLVVTPESASDTHGVNERQFASKESAIEARNKICVEQGGAIETCRCRAETASEVMNQEDFSEETQYLFSGNQKKLQEFQNRMLAQQPERLFELGKALAQCPATIKKLE